MPHLDAAYNLARWLTRSEADAEDVVQEALLRAYRFFAGFRGSDARAWLLAIVRNTCHTWLRRNRSHEFTTADEDSLEEMEADAPSPEELALRSADAQEVRRALEGLPVEFREVMVLRELEGMSYKEIASVADVPVGTVMSRLARARKRMREALACGARTEARG